MNLIVLLFFSISLATVTAKLECNYSQYMLDYFKHNEVSLLEMEKCVQDITVDDVLTFNQAVQTHDIIVLCFLEDLKAKNHFTSFDLISVNLYLNNIGNHLNIVEKDNSINQEQPHPALSFYNEDSKDLYWKTLLINGSKIIFRILIERLEHQIKINCKDVTISKSNFFVKSNVMKPYLPSDLLVVNKNLRDETITKFSDITNSSNLNLHPKRYFLYHIFMYDFYGYTQEEFKENYLLKQKQKNLNLIRLTPLSYKCSNGKNLTLFELSFYMYHTFNVEDLKIFQKIVFVAFFRPIAILIRNFIIVAKKISSIDTDKKNASELKEKIVVMGYSIHYYIYKFIKYTCDLPKNRNIHFMRALATDMFSLVSKYKEYYSQNLDEQLADKLMNTIRNIMILSKIKFSTKLKLNTIETIDGNQVIEQAICILREVEKYIMELQIWKDDLNDVMENQSLINSLYDSNKEEFLTTDIINYLCHRSFHGKKNEVFTDNLNVGLFEEDSNKDSVDDTVYIDKEFVLDELVKLELNEDKMWSNKLFYTPKHLINYIRYH
ncbi:uncharacterized protein LOC126901610 [Daktulosphaira vitifoliae]|uniref:uncharacterized protein LOC126901610 n=1 Tax=Daktulosphaira vitifoliae TaxID=58002 RepID=UPI0021AAE4F4|nr:uncharacterized protein LOC126901610 [Daktulosphaira vitifoliae]